MRNQPAQRRRFPWWLMVIAFIGIPILEIYVIIQVGQVIGAWWTVALLVADSIFGSWLVKREGSRAWRALRTALSEGKLPARELADGVLIVIGGTLMISPGFVSDGFGMLCILPFTRPAGRRLLTAFMTRNLIVVGTQRHPAYGAQGDVVRGDVLDDTDY